MVQKLTADEIRDMPGAMLQRTLQTLQQKAAGSGHSTEPTILMNIEDIKKEQRRRQKLQDDVNSW